MAFIITSQKGRGALNYFTEMGQWSWKKADARRFTDRAEADQFVETFTKQNSRERGRTYFRAVEG